jgi:hypothetical protein
MITMTDIHYNINQIKARIAQAAGRAGRRPEEIKLMAVTKTVPLETIQLALDNGLRLLGESRIQEAMDKFGTPPGRQEPLELHLIGHLQRNKAKQAVQVFDWVQSLDKPETARELQKWAARADKHIQVLIEVNTSGEDSKYGLRTGQELFDCTDIILELSHLHLRGLMTIGPWTDDQQAIRRAFKQLATLYRQLQVKYPAARIDTLSMGMSSDFELAIEEGANLVRIGTKLFGERERV